MLVLFVGSNSYKKNRLIVGIVRIPCCTNKIFYYLRRYDRPRTILEGSNQGRWFQLSELEYKHRPAPYSLILEPIQLGTKLFRLSGSELHSTLFTHMLRRRLCRKRSVRPLHRISRILCHITAARAAGLPLYPTIYT